MRSPGYRIVDEPSPSGVSHLAVRPLWPLLGLMLGGAWLGWPWFALNAVALGVHRRNRALGWLALSAAIAILFAVGMAALFHAGRFPRNVYPWLSLVLSLWKLTSAYVAYEHQEPSSELFIYFGGKVRNPALLVAAAAFFGRSAVLDWLTDQSGSLASVAYLVLK